MRDSLRRRVGSRHIRSVFLCALMLAGCGRSADYYLQKGKQLFAEGKIDDAALNYRKAVQKNPQLGEAYFRLGLCRVKEGRVSEAYDAFKQAIQKAPNLTEAKVSLADLLLRSYLADVRQSARFYDPLKAMLPDLVARNPRCADCLRIQGYVQLVDRKPTDALASFRKANEIQPMQNEIVRGMVIALGQNKQNDEAEKLALSLIAKDKTYGQIYDDLYALYQSESRPGDAERIFQLKVANNPTVAAYRLQLAAHYYNSKRNSEFEATVRPLREDRKTYPRGAIDLAEFYMRLSKWPEAQAILDETARQDLANRRFALDLELKVMVAAGHDDEALRLVDQVLKEFPDDSGARFLQASLWVDSKDGSKASLALKALEKMQPERAGEPLYWQAMGRAHALLHEAPKAQAAYVKAASLDAGFKQPRISLAELSLSAGKADDALRYAGEAMAIDPYDGHARLLHATALMQSHRTSEATAELNSLVKAAPQLEDAQFDLALIYLSTKRYAEAEAIFSKLYRAGDKDLRALTGLAQINMEQGHMQRAVDLLNADLKTSSNPDGVRRLLAQTDLAVHQPEGAIQQYTEILKTEPQSARDYYMLAQAYQAKGELAAAVSSMEQAERITPDDPGVISELAYLLQQTGRNQEAADRFRHVLKLRPNDPNTMNNLAYLLADGGGNLDEALRLAEGAVQAAPRAADFADTLGLVYLKKKMSGMAIQTLQAAARNSPGNPTYAYHLGLAELEAGNTRDARVTLQAALEKKPTESEASEIRKALGRVSP